MPKTLIAYSYKKPEKQTDRGSVWRSYCDLPDGETCSLRERGVCMSLTVMGRCKYGQRVREMSPVTARAKSYSDWARTVRDGKAEEPLRAYYGDTIEEIGEYIWLPFPHITSCESVPFMSRPTLISSGMPLLRRKSFTAENVVKLVHFRARGILHSSEIKDYRLESVPTMLYQLKMRHRDLWDEAVEMDPSVEEKTPGPDVFRGVRVPLAECPPGEYEINTRTSDKPQVVKVTWDGERASFTLPASRLWSVLPSRSERSDNLATIELEPYDEFVVTPPDEEVDRLYEEGVFIGLEKHVDWKNLEH